MIVCLSMIKYNPQAIINLMHKHKIGYSGLANAIHTDRQKVREWVKNGRQPAADTLMNIAQKYNVPMSYFFKEVK
jgi:transcriptional regulator with XRE-family HTH domain